MANPVIEAAQRKTSLAMLAAQQKQADASRAHGTITAAEHARRSARIADRKEKANGRNSDPAHS